MYGERWSLPPLVFALQPLRAVPFEYANVLVHVFLLSAPFLFFFPNRCSLLSFGIIFGWIIQSMDLDHCSEITPAC